MFIHYFKTAWRSLIANRFYSVLNICGLAVGLATGIMLLLWVENEFSYDKFNKQYKDIYQLSAHFPSDGKPMVWSNVPGPLSVYAKNISGVKSMVRICNAGDILSDPAQTKIFDHQKIVYADSSLLSIFDYQILYGNAKNYLPNKYSVALSQSTAAKVFGKENAIGKVVRFGKDNFTVSTVFKDLPKNSSIGIDAVLPMAYRAKIFTENGGNGDWKTIDTDLGDYNISSYVLLYPNANPKQIGDLFSKAYKQARNGDSKTTFELQNIGDIHLIGNDGDTTALRMVKIMMLVAILILTIASINYVNLSTARSLTRLKEVGIKKVIGASKKQLFLQFIGETSMLFTISLVIAVGLIFALMPLYNKISGKELSFSLFDMHSLMVLFIALIGSLLASSIYPAILLTSFRPLAAIGGYKIGGIRTGKLRKALVLLQFIISFMLLVGTIVMKSQMRYMRDLNLGYDKSYVFAVPFPDAAFEHFDAVKTELNSVTGILNVGVSDAYDATDITGSTSDLDWSGKPKNKMALITQVAANKDFIPTMKYQFIEGGNFLGMPSDSNKYIVNESAVMEMGLKPPYVGQQISFHDLKGEIIGVLKDFHFRPLTEALSPIIFFTSWGSGNMLYVRTTGADAQKAIAAVEQQYKKYNVNKIPFSYNFLDKNFETHYVSQERTSKLFTIFATVAIFISCLGLFGLATYTAQVKTKEIGIRKVLGANIATIMKLISFDFLKLVFFSIVIATPLAYWAMSKWLNNFAYRTHISVEVFIVAAGTVFLISLLTVGFHAFRAAKANPVKSLRSE